jgi:hypothetical protein
VPGQIVVDRNGNLYMVNQSNPSGIPGSSSSYTPLAGVTGPKGATGAGSTIAPPYNSTAASGYVPRTNSNGTRG